MVKSVYPRAGLPLQDRLDEEDEPVVDGEELEVLNDAVYPCCIIMTSNYDFNK